MLDTLKLKYFQGKQYIPDIKNAPMREQFRGFPILKSGKVNESICPTGALKSNPISIDLGKCTLCVACRCETIQFSNYYKLSSTQSQKRNQKSVWKVFKTQTSICRRLQWL